MSRSGFFELISRIKRELASGDDPRDLLERLEGVLADTDVLHVFFERLDTPEWIPPLRERGFFADPPRTIAVEGGGMKYPPWPASRYLARMAGHKAEEVCQILAEIETDNPNIIRDIARAVLEMPAEFALPLVSKITGALAADVWPLFYREETSKLIAKLAQEGEGNAALELAKALFFIEPSEGSVPGLKPRVEYYWYDQYLRAVVSPLVMANPRESLGWVCAILSFAIEHQAFAPPSEEFNDQSYIWRPAIEDHPQNTHQDIPNTLINAVRDGAEQSVQDDLLTLSDVVEMLEGQRRLLFHRLSLHLIRMFGEKDSQLAQQRMVNKHLFDDYMRRHEYALLLRDRFGMLSTDDQRTILSWIEAGPDLEGFEDQFQASVGRPAIQDDIDGRRKVWQRDRLSWFHESLPHDWQSRYRALAQEVGEPNHPDFPFWTSASWEHVEEPGKTKELSRKSPAEIVDYLSTFRPDSDEFMGLSVEGLANDLREVVNESPERFAREAMLFVDADLNYVHAVLGGFTNALEKDKRFDVRPVLNLCLSAIDRPQEPPQQQPARRHRGGPENLWRWTRDAIIRLIRTACEKGLSIELKDRLWEVLTELTNETTQCNIVETGREDDLWRDFADHTINTPRANALHAVCEYAFWVKKKTAEQGGTHATDFPGFSAIPEAQRVLEHHLDPTQQNPPHVHAVYGWRFCQLHWLDADWAASHVEAIFPMEGARSKVGWGAWTTYLAANRAYDRVFELLRTWYRFAVDDLANYSQTVDSPHNTMRRLAEHVMVLYARGRDALEDGQSLINRFFAKAPADLRAYMIRSIALSVEGDEEVPAEVFNRFMRLWEWYWEGFSGPEGKATQEELAEFGWWFTSGAFDEAWCLSRLKEVTEVAAGIKPDHEIMKRLVHASERMPCEAVTCASSMARGDIEGWRLASWREELNALIQNVMRSDNSEAKQVAAELIDLLGRRGFLEFGDLLP